MIPLFNLGFRPFFLSAGLFAAIAMALWGLSYAGLLSVPTPIPAMFWHGHEMIFGYGVAVLAGFLLTAVRNWTGLDTPRGVRLAGISLLWLVARIAFWFGNLPLAMGADLLFSSVLLVSLIKPLISTRQTNQVGLMTLLCLLLATNQLFYLVAIFNFDPVTLFGSTVTTLTLHQALLTGLYLLAAIVLTMICRLLPAFTRMATGGSTNLVEFAHLERPITILMGLFVLLAPQWVAFSFSMQIAQLIALCLAALHGYRLWHWRHREIATRPLLWVIYIAYFFFVIGFAAFAAQFSGMPAMVATHAFAAGGIGLATLGLMTRVALGHTGRNVYDPPRLILPMIVLLAAGAAVRVFSPILIPGLYFQAVIVAQVFWVAAFLVFVVIITPLLVTRRPDGQPG